VASPNSASHQWSRSSDILSMFFPLLPPSFCPAPRTHPYDKFIYFYPFNPSAGAKPRHGLSLPSKGSDSTWLWENN
jgi:hypothetical protein